jgi:hypothetical protein
VADTVRGFKEILEGKHDEVPEANFYMKGGIEEIQASAGGETAGETAKAKKTEGTPSPSSKARGEQKGQPT